jgi:hypothetical protein
MNIKNYTSGVPAERSINRIEKILVEMGATSVNKQYNKDKKIEAIAFLIIVDGNTIPFKLPAKASEVESVLIKSVRRMTEGARTRVKEQSERTAWRLVQEWVEIQMSMIQLKQADFIEVFLPYVYDYANNKTFYQSIKDGGFKQLPSGK